MGEENVRSIIMEFLIRHFVGVYGEIRNESGEVMRSAYSGVLATIAGQVVVCGAGHCFRELEYFVSRGHRTKRCYLVDPRYPESNIESPPAIAFDWEQARPWIVVDETSGADFGALFINGLAIKALEAHGKIPIRLDDVVALPDHAAFYALLGLPKSQAHLTEKYGVVGVYRYIIRKKDPDPDLDLASKIATFYGELPEGAGNIVGVSGGPLFGWDHDETKGYYYWLHAIQRGQLGREIRAPLITELARMLREEIGKRAKEQ